MKKSTRQIIKILLEADDTIPIEHQKNIIEIVTNRPKRDSTPPLLLTKVQTAELLSVSIATVYRMVKAGDIQPVMIHGATRYRREDVAKIAQNGTG